MASSLPRSARRLSVAGATAATSAAKSSRSSSASLALALATANRAPSLPGPLPLSQPPHAAVLGIRSHSRTFSAASLVGTGASGATPSTSSSSSSSSSSPEAVRELTSQLKALIENGQYMRGTAPPDELDRLSDLIAELDPQETSLDDLAAISALLEAAKSKPSKLRSLTTDLLHALTERLTAADAKALAAVARSFARARARSELVLTKLADRAAELGAASDAGTKSNTKANASLLDSFGKLASRGDGGRRFGRRTEATPGHGSQKEPPSWIQKAATLQEPLARGAQDMRPMDIALALAGLARLGGSGSNFFEACHLRLRDLAEASRRPDAIVEPRLSAMLLSSLAAQARLGDQFRHPGCLQTVASMLATATAHGKPVPQDFLLPMLRALCLNLQPAPDALLPVLEVSIAQNASQYRARELSLLLKHVAMLPGLRATRHSLGRQLFSAALAAPLSELSSEGLANALRAAWSLGHPDASFWGVCLRACRDRILDESDPSPDRRPSLDDLMNMALVSGRLLERATATAGRSHASSEAPAVAAALAASGKAPAYLTGGPAAAKLLEAACLEALTGRHESFLASRHLATFAAALARAGQDNGTLFSMISHRTLVQLEGNAPFNARDVAQLLAALAHFQYQDEALLSALVERADMDFDSYDSKARDSVLWSISELGIEPVSRGTLSDALLEYDLKRGVATDSTESHLASIEVHPSLDDVHDGFGEAQYYGSYRGERYETSNQDWKLQPERPSRDPQSP